MHHLQFAVCYFSNKGLTYTSKMTRKRGYNVDGKKRRKRVDLEKKNKNFDRKTFIYSRKEIIMVDLFDCRRIDKWKLVVNVCVRLLFLRRTRSCWQKRKTSMLIRIVLCFDVFLILFPRKKTIIVITRINSNTFSYVRLLNEYYLIFESLLILQNKYQIINVCTFDKRPYCVKSIFLDSSQFIAIKL